MINAGLEIIMALINGISQSLPTLIPAIVSAVILIAQSLIDNIDLIIQAGIKRVVYGEKYRLEDGIDLLRKAGIEVVYINLDEYGTK